MIGTLLQMKLKNYTNKSNVGNKYLKIKFALVFFWVVLLFYFSIKPITTGDAVAGFLIPGFDHIFAYFILSCSLFFLLLDFRKNYLFFIPIIISFFYGFGMEVIQGFLPWRDFSLVDSLFNLVGSSLIILIKLFLLK